MLEKDIQDIGLSEKEAKVYLATLELSQGTAQEISKKSKINRATTYTVIESLTKLGLISNLQQGKKQLFTAASPSRLLEILEMEKTAIDNKKVKLSKLMPEIQSIYNKQENKPVVRYFEGKEGIKTMNEEFIKSAPKIARMIYSVDNSRALFTDQEKAKFRKERIGKNIKNKVIYTFKNGVFPSEESSDRLKIPFDKFPVTTDIGVYDNKIRLINYTTKVGVTIIEDEEMAETMKALIDLASEAAEKYNK